MVASIDIVFFSLKVFSDRTVLLSMSIICVLKTELRCAGFIGSKVEILEGEYSVFERSIIHSTQERIHIFVTKYAHRRDLVWEQFVSKLHRLDRWSPKPFFGRTT
jgi:hypothetical protein